MPGSVLRIGYAKFLVRRDDAELSLDWEKVAAAMRPNRNLRSSPRQYLAGTRLASLQIGRKVDL